MALLPTKKITALAPFTPPLTGDEEFECVQLSNSRKVTSRAFVLPTDPLLTFASVLGNLPGSRVITAGIGIEIALIDPGQFVISMLGTGALPANPTALVGLTPVNGVAGTWMRSDAAPALDQAIVPVWTGAHSFTAVGSNATPSVLVSSTSPLLMIQETDAAVDNRLWRFLASGEQLQFSVLNDALGVATEWLTVDRTGTTVDIINLISTNLLWNGAPIAGGVTGTANPTAQVGLVAVNGIALTALRSDGAPALSQAIAPTWTALHTFSLVGDPTTTPSVSVSSTRPILNLDETDGAADNRRWLLQAQSETLFLSAYNDAGTVAGHIMQVDRTGATIDLITFLATAMTLNAQTYIQDRMMTNRSVVSVVGAATNVDLSQGNEYLLTMGASTTLTFLNPPPTGQTHTFTLFIQQDGTGSRTITWPASVHFSDGITPTLTTTANRTDAVTLTTFDGGTTYYGGQVLANMVP